MGFSNWISGLFASKENEENKDNNVTSIATVDTEPQIHNQAANLEYGTEKEIVLEINEIQEIGESISTFSSIKENENVN